MTPKLLHFTDSNHRVAMNIDVTVVIPVYNEAVLEGRSEVLENLRRTSRRLR